MRKNSGAGSFVKVSTGIFSGTATKNRKKQLGMVTFLHRIRAVFCFIPVMFPAIAASTTVSGNNIGKH